MEDFIYDEALDSLEAETPSISDTEEVDLYDSEENNSSDQECEVPPSPEECPMFPEPETNPITSKPFPEPEPKIEQEPYYYKQEIDRNGDGQTDMIVNEYDTDGGGIVDFVDIQADNNYDGNFESRQVLSDEDGDGFYDISITESDTNGNGVVDYHETIMDTNGNGRFDEGDSYDISFDSNHTGIDDTHLLQVDRDGDGIIDYAKREWDYNNDGAFDSIKTLEDTTYDGKIDKVSEIYDSNDDGKLDMAEIHYDYDGDGKADWTQFCVYRPETGKIIPLNDPPEYAGVSGTFADELPQFKPDENYPEDICGDPATSMKYWEHQGESGPCALYSQMFIIKEFTGLDIDINEFTAMARSNGWYPVEGGGTVPLNMGKMLDAYGIENEMSFHNDMDDIEECLDEGGRIIVAIDADEIWYGEGGDLFSPTAAANHAVEVIGIDYSNSDCPMVILNDSGTPNGCGEMVPLNDFMDAWKDSECQMIKCYPNKH